MVVAMVAVVAATVEATAVMAAAEGMAAALAVWAVRVMAAVEVTSTLAADNFQTSRRMVALAMEAVALAVEFPDEYRHQRSP